MDSFSIRQLAQFAGIKPHTIRIWEQRYNALQPNRSEGNTRHYDGQQLRRLLNIVSLLESGNKVSHLCTLSDKELFDLNFSYEQQASENSDYGYYISNLIAGGMNFDEYQFDKILSHCLLHLGVEKTYSEIIYPFLKRIGLMWFTDKMPPSQEHYMSNLLKQKMFTAIDAIPATNEGADSWLLFLPEDEFHEIGLLFSNYLIRSSGGKVIYLGANVPLASIDNAIEQTKVNNLLLFLVHRNLPENVGEYLGELTKIARNQKIFIAAGKDFSEKVSTKSPFNWLHSVEDLKNQLKKEPQV
jgi:hypothetical protein